MITKSTIRSKQCYLAAVVVSLNLVCAVPSEAENLNQHSQPVLTIGRLFSPVKLDGKLDDVGWKSSALLEGFTCMDKRYPTDMTRARMAYDATHLFIAVECQQRVLDPAYQRLNEFAKRIKKRDGRVHSDDSVEVFFSADGKKYWHFMFNALGVKYDALGSDKTWNGDWEVVCQIQNGKWTAELKVPLKEIGIKPKLGSEFYFNICRNQKANDETSSWSPVSMGFHDVDQFAMGRLEVNAAALDADSFIRSLSEKRSVSSLQLAASSVAGQKQKVQVRLIPSDKKAAAKILSGNTASGKYTFPLVLEKAGAYRLQYEMVRRDGQILFRSPLYTMAQKAVYSANVKLTSGTLLKALMNGKQQRCDGPFILKEGINDISLECALADQGRIEGELQLQSTTGPTLKIAIDGQWQMKKSASAGNKVVLSRQIAVKTSFFHPVVKEDKLYVAHGTSQHAPIIVVNPTKSRMQELRFIIDLPKGLELVGIEREMKAAKRYPARGRLRRVFQRETGNRSDSNRFVFEFENIEPFKGGAAWKAHIHGLVFRLCENVDTPLNVFYRIEGKNEDVNLVEAWNTLTVVPLKQAKAKRPERMATVLWHGSRTGSYNHVESRALIKSFADVGFNSYIDRTSWSTPKGRPRSVWLKELHRQNFFVILEIGFNHFTQKLMKKYPDQHATGFNGKPAPIAHIKPEFIIADARSTFVEYIKQLMLASGAHASILDLEFDPFIICDASESTRKKFAEFAGLKKTPTPSEIKTRYRQQWVSYMCDVWSRVMKIYRDGTKAAGQDRQVWLYSAYPGQVYRERYAIDWSLMRETVDVAAMGYNIPSAHTLKALNGQAKLNAGILHFEGSVPEQYRSLKWRMLRCVAEGADGFCLFYWTVLDGRAYVLISEAIGLMADCEDFFVEGKRIKPFASKGNIPTSDFYLYEYKGRKLLLVFNDSSKTRKATVNLGRRRQVEDYYTGKKFTKGFVEVEVQPHDVKAYLID